MDLESGPTPTDEREDSDVAEAETPEFGAGPARTDEETQPPREFERPPHRGGERDRDRGREGGGGGGFRGGERRDRDRDRDRGRPREEHRGEFRGRDRGDRPPHERTHDRPPHERRDHERGGYSGQGERHDFRDRDRGHDRGRRDEGFRRGGEGRGDFGGTSMERERDRGSREGGRPVEPRGVPLGIGAGSATEAPIGILATQRVAVLVDLHGLNHAARGLYGAKLSYQKLARQLSRGRSVGRMIAYFSDRDLGGEGLSDHASHLISNGFELRGADLPGRGEPEWSKSACVAMSVDALALAERCDAVVLATHDAAFAVLAKALAARGVRAEIAGFRERMSEELLAAAAQFVPLGRDCLFVP